MKKIIDTTISSFPELIQSGNLYVDKTAFLFSLIKGQRMFFCARPRRFGKTLALSTLEAIFSGRRDLFKGLSIDRMDYDWKAYPVVHIDMSQVSTSLNKH